MKSSREQFEEWWNSPANADLRRSCSKGWGLYIWRKSRQALANEEVTTAPFLKVD